jgi:hypothetical protein
MTARGLLRAGARDFGVVVTSGEELGLAGAHAFASARKPGQAINCDSVDSVGDFLLLMGRTGDGRVAAVAREVQGGFETGFREMRTLPGVLVDSVALQKWGWDAITVCRGGLDTLRRIHTVKDVVSGGLSEGSTYASVLIRDISLRLLSSPVPDRKSR